MNTYWTMAAIDAYSVAFCIKILLDFLCWSVLSTFPACPRKPTFSLAASTLKKQYTIFYIDSYRNRCEIHTHTRHNHATCLASSLNQSKKI